MKKNIIILCVFSLITAAFIITLVCLFKERKESKRLLENYKIEATAKYEYLQSVTEKELKDIYKMYYDALKEYKIKPKDVESIVEIEYRYVDSVRHHDTLVFIYDTIRKYDIAEFSIGGNCWSLSGSVYNNNVVAENFRYNDSILISVYKEKRKCLFGKRHVKAIAISACTNDTLTILRNLEVLH